MWRYDGDEKNRRECTWTELSLPLALRLLHREVLGHFVAGSTESRTDKRYGKAHRTADGNALRCLRDASDCGSRRSGVECAEEGSSCRVTH